MKSLKKRAASLPRVSVCTPTYNRRPFLPILFQCFKHQTYPPDKLEWIIVDDGTDCVRDVVEAAGLPQIRYFYNDTKMLLGAKRNYMHTKCTGDILVYMDDDDYYPPERIAHAVEKLMQNPHKLCAGSSEMYVYFNEFQKMYQFGPYGENHACAATFAFRRELLEQTRYDDTKALAEEKAFLKNNTIPMVQLDPRLTILVFAHSQNSFDKKKALPAPGTNNGFVKESTRTVADFIKYEYERPVYNFFINIEAVLEAYSLGRLQHKPDVVQQIHQLEQERAALATNPAVIELTAALQQQAHIIQQQNYIIQELQQNKIAVVRGAAEPPMILTHIQVVELIQQQQKMIELLKTKLEQERRKP
jgi:glycosyltransferase involved in cell wall biosynthesis